MFTQLGGPLRFRRFRIVLLGEALSMFGDSAFAVALAWLVLQETGSVTALATVMLAQAIPRGLLLLVGGATSDRFSPATTMMCSHLLRGTAVATIAVLTVADALEMWHLYGLALVIGVAAAFFDPASESILPQLLPREHLPRGNALQGLAEQGALVLGPVLGGLITVWLGPAAAIGINAVSFFVAAVTVCSAPRDRVDDAQPVSIGAVLREIGQGLQFARRSPEIRTVLLIVSAYALSYSGIFAVGLPALARSFSLATPLALGMLISAWGVGQLAGTLSAAITGLPRRWGLLIIGMTLVEGVAFTILGVSPNVLVAVTILAILGFGVAYASDVALPTFIQTRTPPHLLGRISSVMNLPRVVLEPLSILLLGILLDHSVPLGFAAAAVPVLVVGLRLALDPQARHLSTERDAVGEGSALRR